MKKILSLVLIFVLSLTFAGITQEVKAAEGDATVYFHVNQFDGDYTNTGIGIWDGIDWNGWGDNASTTVMPTDDFGAVIQFVIPAAKLADGNLMDEIQLEITRSADPADDGVSQGGYLSPGNGKVFADITSLKDGSKTELHVYYIEGMVDTYIPNDDLGTIFITYIDPKVASNESIYDDWSVWTWDNGTGGTVAGGGVDDPTQGVDPVMDMTVKGMLGATTYNMSMKLFVIEVGADAISDSGFIMRTDDWGKQCGQNIMIDNSTVRGEGVLLYNYQAGSCELETDGAAYLADVTAKFDLNAGNRFMEGTIITNPTTVEVELLMPRNAIAYSLDRFKLLDANGVMIPIESIAIEGAEKLGAFTSSVTCMPNEYHFVLYLDTSIDHTKLGVVGSLQGWSPENAITAVDDSMGNAVFETCTDGANKEFKILYDANDNGFAWGDVELTPANQAVDLSGDMGGIFYMSVEDLTVEDITPTVNLVGDVEKYVKVYVDTTNPHAELGLVGSFQGWDIGNVLTMTEDDSNGYAVFEFIADSDAPEFKLVHDADGTFEWGGNTTEMTTSNVVLDLSNTDVLTVFIEHDGTTTMLPDGTNLLEVDPADYTYTAGAACGAGENKLTLFVDTPENHDYIGAVGTINGWNIGGSVTPIGDTGSGLAVIEICTPDATGEFKVMYDDEEDGTFEWDPADVALTNGNQAFDFDGETEMAILISGTDLTDLGVGTFTAAVTPVNQVLRLVRIWVKTDKDHTKLGLVGNVQPGDGWDVTNVIPATGVDANGNAYFELAVEGEDLDFKVLFDEDGTFEWGGNTEEITPENQVFEGIGNGIDIYIRDGEGTTFNMDHQFVPPMVMPIISNMVTFTLAAEDALMWGEEYTVEYLDRLAVLSGAEVFISEYIEGTSNNKALEIFNPTDNSIDLTGYVINYYNNGAETPTKSFDLTGVTLASGETFTLCTDSYANQDDCDESQAYADPDAVVFYNGDDAIELTKDGEVIDVIGVVGEDPGSNWPVGDGATNEHTLRRNAEVVHGNTTFTADEWEVLAQDTFDGLGAHTGMVGDIAEPAEYIMSEVLTFGVSEMFEEAMPVEGMGTYAITPTQIQVVYGNAIPAMGSLELKDEDGNVIPFESVENGNMIGTYETDKRCHHDQDLFLIHVALTKTMVEDLDQLGIVGTINGWDISNAIQAAGMDSEGNYVFEVCLSETETAGEFKVKFDPDMDGFTWDSTNDPEITPSNISFNVADGPSYFVEELAGALDLSATHIITLSEANMLDKTKEYTLEFTDANGFVIYIPVDMDTQAPVIDYSIIPDVEFEVESELEFDLLDYYAKIQFLDNREGELEYEFVTNIDLDTLGEQTVTIKAVDGWMNETTFDMTFTVVDTIAPTISGDETVTFDAGTAEPTWTDYVTAEGGTVTVNTDQVDMDVAGTFFVMFTATDANGNTATHSLEVTIEGDTTPDTGCFSSISLGTSIVLAVAALGGAVVLFSRKR